MRENLTKEMLLADLENIVLRLRRQMTYASIGEIANSMKKVLGPDATTLASYLK